MYLLKKPQISRKLLIFLFGFKKNIKRCIFRFIGKVSSLGLNFRKCLSIKSFKVLKLQQIMTFFQRHAQRTH